MKINSLLSTIAFFLLTTAFAVAQCPMCKNVAMSAQRETGRGTTLNQGIMYLFILPYLGIGTIAYFWYRGYKRKKMAEAAENT